MNGLSRHTTCLSALKAGTAMSREEPGERGEAGEGWLDAEELGAALRQSRVLLLDQKPAAERDRAAK